MADKTSPTSTAKSDLAPRKVDLQRELVVGTLVYSSFQLFSGEYMRTLPHYTDDVERDFGLDIYEKMLHDPAVSASIGAIKESVLAHGIRIVGKSKRPPVTKEAEDVDPQESADYETSEEIREFVERMFERLNPSLEATVYDMLDCVAFGHSTAEKVYEVFDGKLMLRKLGVKPRRFYAFVVTPYLDLVGLIGIEQVGMTALTLLSTIPDPKQIIPGSKFVTLTFNQAGGDPRGRSILRDAYTPWYIKQQLPLHYLKFLTQFGTPSMVGTLHPGAGDVEIINTDGTQRVDSGGMPIVLTAEEAMLQKLISFSNGTAIVVPNEAKVDIAEPSTDGEAYVKAFKHFNSEIVLAIHNTVRAIIESEHGSKADTSTAKDIFDLLTQRLTRLVEVTFYRDVIKPTVAMNYGEEVADRLSPTMQLSNVAAEDTVAYGNMIASLSKGYLHVSQYPEIDAQLGLPERDIDSQISEMREEREAQQQQQEAMRNMINPTGGAAKEE